MGVSNLPKVVTRKHGGRGSNSQTLSYHQSGALATRLYQVTLEYTVDCVYVIFLAKVITRAAAIKWQYGISLPVCGLLFQRLYLGPFSSTFEVNVTACDLENSFTFDKEG